MTHMINFHFFIIMIIIIKIIVLALTTIIAATIDIIIIIIINIQFIVCILFVEEMYLHLLCPLPMNS